MGLSKIDIGAQGERLAVAFLKKNGYTILENNFRCRFGEIDIIAREGRTLVFIEVKTKTSSRFGPAKSAVDARKQRQVSKAALSYVSQNKLMTHPARFDVVGVSVIDTVIEIELIKNAFELRV